MEFLAGGFKEVFLGAVAGFGVWFCAFLRTGAEIALDEAVLAGAEVTFDCFATDFAAGLDFCLIVLTLEETVFGEVLFMLLSDLDRGVADRGAVFLTAVLTAGFFGEDVGFFVGAAFLGAVAVLAAVVFEAVAFAVFVVATVFVVAAFEVVTFFGSG